MFELLGFWFSVTLIVGFLLSWTVYVVPLVVDTWVYHVSGKEVKQWLWSKYPKKVRNFLMWDGDFPNITVTILCASGFIVLLCNTLVCYNNPDKDIYARVSNVAIWMAPFMSWVAIVLLVFIGFTWVSKKAYVLSKKVSAVTKKLEEEK